MSLSPRPSVVSGLVMALGLWLLTLVLPNAAANMRPVMMFELTPGTVAVMFLLNLPLNMLFLSTLLLVMCWVWGRKVGRFPEVARAFIGRILVIVIIMTVLGVLIDFLFLYSSETEYAFEYDLTKWLFASVAVGLSVYVLSVALLSMDLALGAVPALFMLAVNLLSWELTRSLFESTSYICLIAPSVLAACLCALPLTYLLKWHNSTFRTQPTAAADLLLI